MPTRTSPTLAGGTLLTISIRLARLGPGAKALRLVESWFVKRTCATASATAGPKDCANSMTDKPSGMSSAGRTVCTAFCGPEKPMPYAKPEKAVYMMSCAKLVLILKVVMRPAATGIMIEAKSMNGV